MAIVHAGHHMAPFGADTNDMVYQNNQSHLVSYCPVPHQFDIGSFAERLLMFDRFTMHDLGCKLVPQVVETVGLVATRTLLESESLVILDDADEVCAYPRRWETWPSVPPLQYRFGRVSIASPDPPLQTPPEHLNPETGEYDDSAAALALRRQRVEEGVAALHFRGLEYRSCQKLKSLLVAKVQLLPSLGQSLQNGLSDLRDRLDLVKIAVREQLHREGVEPPEFDIQTRGWGVPEDPLRIETDLTDRLGKTPLELHKTIQMALLAVLGIHQELAYMSAFNAVRPLPDKDIPLFQAKLDSLASNNEQHLRKSLSRVLSVAKLNDIAGAARENKFSLRKLASICGSAEAKEFRKFLRQAHTYTDDELRKHLPIVRAELTGLLNNKSLPCKLLKFLICDLTPMVATQEPLVGLVFGKALEQGYDKLLSAPGPAVFLQRQVKSLFDE